MYIKYLFNVNALASCVYEFSANFHQKSRRPSVLQHIAIYISIALKRKICGKSVKKKIVSKWLLACVVNESDGGSGARSLAKNTKQKKLCVARALATRTYASLIFATIKKKCKFVSVFWQIVYIFEFIFAHRNKYICVVFRKKYKICI